MAKILATSPNGKLRLRQIGKENGVVELWSEGQEKWVWCVWRKTTLAQARTTFDNQVCHHQ